MSAPYILPCATTRQSLVDNNKKFSQSNLQGIMVCKLDKQIIANEFEPHWVPRISGLVPQLSKDGKKLGALHCVMDYKHTI